MANKRLLLLMSVVLVVGAAVGAMIVLLTGQDNLLVSTDPAATLIAESSTTPMITIASTSTPTPTLTPTSTSTLTDTPTSTQAPTTTPTATSSSVAPTVPANVTPTFEGIKVPQRKIRVETQLEWELKAQSYENARIVTEDFNDLGVPVNTPITLPFTTPTEITFDSNGKTNIQWHLQSAFDSALYVGGVETDLKITFPANTRISGFGIIYMQQGRWRFKVNEFVPTGVNSGSGAPLFLGMFVTGGGVNEIRVFTESNSGQISIDKIMFVIQYNP